MYMISTIIAQTDCAITHKRGLGSSFAGSIRQKFSRAPYDQSITTSDAGGLESVLSPTNDDAGSSSRIDVSHGSAWLKAPQFSFRLR